MQEPNHQLEIDFHSYLIGTHQISYLHYRPFWCRLGPRLLITILHAAFVS